jgi:hypothetical protein
LKKEGKMAKLEGHFQLEKNENMDEYFSKVGKVPNEKPIPILFTPIHVGWVSLIPENRTYEDTNSMAFGVLGISSPGAYRGKQDRD